MALKLSGMISSGTWAVRKPALGLPTYASCLRAAAACYSLVYTLQGDTLALVALSCWPRALAHPEFRHHAALPVFQ